MSLFFVAMSWLLFGSIHLVQTEYYLRSKHSFQPQLIQTIYKIGLRLVYTSVQVKGN